VSRAATSNNGLAHAAAPQPGRIVVMGWRGLTIAVVIQLIFSSVLTGLFVGGMNARLDSIDRRLSRLDGVPR
jgi:hypothetical protein